MRHKITAAAACAAAALAIAGCSSGSSSSGGGANFAATVSQANTRLQNVLNTGQES